MAALTKLQLDHARLRLSEAKMAYIERQLAALGPQPEEVELDDDELMTRIREGRAVLRKGISRYCNVRDAFNPVLTLEELNQQEKYNAYMAARDRVIEAADAKMDRVIDELIMSPDGMSALQKIADAFKDE